MRRRRPRKMLGAIAAVALLVSGCGGSDPQVRESEASPSPSDAKTRSDDDAARSEADAESEGTASPSQEPTPQAPQPPAGTIRVSGAVSAELTTVHCDSLVPGLLQVVAGQIEEEVYVSFILVEGELVEAEVLAPDGTAVGGSSAEGDVRFSDGTIVMDGLTFGEQGPSVVLDGEAPCPPDPELGLPPPTDS